MIPNTIHQIWAGNSKPTQKILDTDPMAKVANARLAKAGKAEDPNYLTNIYLKFYNICLSKNIKVYNLSKTNNSRLPYPEVDIDIKKMLLLKE
jgi:hypothetical protein